MTRHDLVELRRIALRNLADRWVTPTEVAEALGVGRGRGWLMVALTLERLANDGLAEIHVSGRRRYFRKARS